MGLLVAPAAGVVALPGEVLPPSRRGAGFGFFYVIYYVCMGVVPVVAGYLVDRGGGAAALWLAAFLWLAPLPLSGSSARSNADGRQSVPGDSPQQAQVRRPDWPACHTDRAPAAGRVWRIRACAGSPGWPCPTRAGRHHVSWPSAWRPRFSVAARTAAACTAAPASGSVSSGLAIVDLATGDQPIGNEDGSILVVCNGEIYNHVALRQWLEARGHRFRTRLRRRGHRPPLRGGGRRERPPAARDVRLRALGRPAPAALARAGPARDQAAPTTPTRSTGLYFASEQKAILAAGVPPGPLDVRALDELFLFGFILVPGTLFRGIRRLPPGHWLLYDGGRTVVRPYWRLAEFSPANLATSVAPRTGPRLFTRSWRRQWRCMPGPTCASAPG